MAHKIMLLSLFSPPCKVKGLVACGILSNRGALWVGECLSVVGSLRKKTRWCLCGPIFTIVSRLSYMCLAIREENDRLSKHQ